MSTCVANKDQPSPMLIIRNSQHSGDEIARILRRQGLDAQLLTDSNNQSQRACTAMMLAIEERQRGKAKEELFNFGPWQFKPEHFVLNHTDGSAIPLTAREEILLHTLLKHPKRAFTREMLIEQFNDFQRPTSARAIDSSMSRLRAKMNDSVTEPKWIKSIYGVGYIMACSVERLSI